MSVWIEWEAEDEEWKKIGSGMGEESGSRWRGGVRGKVVVDWKWRLDREANEKRREKRLSAERCGAEMATSREVMQRDLTSNRIVTSSTLRFFHTASRTARRCKGIDQSHYKFPQNAG